MAPLLDRLLLFAISILLMNKNQVDYRMVCLILVVVIAEAMMLYFRQRNARIAITGIFIVGSLVVPELVAFYPIFVYEGIRGKCYPMVGVEAVVAVFTYIMRFDYDFFSPKIYALCVFFVLAFCWGIKAEKEKYLAEQVHHLQDEESYRMLRNKQTHAELVKKQDTEIRAATLAERNRIAREIHDHVGHMLSRSILQLGAILAINKDEKLQAPLKGLKDTLDTAMNNIRESVHDLKDDSMDMELMVLDIAKQYDNLEIEVDYDMSRYLSKELKYCLVAIVKEALTNTTKHSDGTKVSIVMREHPALYQVLIADNGSKRKEAEEAIGSFAGTAGIGLENMRERVYAFGGNVRFSVDGGFKIFISIPKNGENS